MVLVFATKANAAETTTALATKANASDVKTTTDGLASDIATKAKAAETTTALATKGGEGGRGAGADGFVVYAERATPELRHMIERLVHAGFRIKLAQSVLEMIDHIHPTDRLLMIADGVVASADIVERTIACPDEAIATIADIPANIAFERLDGKARWAGLAVLEGGRVAAIRSMPEDWDVQSTLLRSAVQIGHMGIFLHMQ